MTVSSNLATAIRTIVILLIAWRIAAFTGEVHWLPTISRPAWLVLILSAVATGLSWLCYFRALQLGKASYAAPIDKASVVMVLVLAALFLGEPITWKSASGTAVILVGVLLLIL